MKHTNGFIKVVKIMPFAGLILFCLSFSSCKKLVDIKPPTNTIVTEEVFKDSAGAAAAIAGLYTNLNSVALSFGTGSLSVFCGESSDELVPFFPTGELTYSNSLLANYGSQYNLMWSPAYKAIYMANSIIEGLQESNGVDGTTKVQFTTEARFIRAFCYFYLINLFGDVPYLVTSDFHFNSLASRTPKDQIYKSIVSELKDAQNLLPSDFSAGAGERIRANKWASTALLARAYLYMNKYDSAENQANLLINNSSLFALNTDLNKIYQRNNSESILQWQLNIKQGQFNATPEGLAIIPANNTTGPKYFVSSQLLNSFENNDQRKIAWLSSTTYQAVTYYYPYKYKIGPAQRSTSATLTEYPTILRLAEQYLIRAEARAQQNNLTGAIADLNVIRNRAGLPSLSLSLNQAQVLAAVMQERRIELFAEWGHRWLDLKRTGQVDAVMTIATPAKGQNTVWQSYQQLYPIPLADINTNPNLTQNTGY